MNQIYWITRLDSITTVFTVFLVLSSILLGICMITYILCYCNEQMDFDKEENKAYREKATYFFKYIIVIFIFCILGKVFVPTTKEGLLIYGVGGTIDYIKSNPTAKRIPDKCVEALDKWVDTLTTDSLKNKK